MMNDVKEKAITVSVILPIYNTAAYLRQCLDSIISQDYPAMEIICVDDGSTDGSDAILEEYNKRYKFITLLHQQNAGAGAARNTGLKSASGKYVFFCDSDDYCYPGLFEKTVSLAEEKAADIVAFHFDKLYPDGKLQHTDSFHRSWLRKRQIWNLSLCPDRIFSLVSTIPWNRIYLRDFVVGRGLLFDEIMSSNDITFCEMSLAKANRIALMGEYLYCHRMGRSGSLTTEKYKNLHNVCVANESLLAQASKLPRYAEVRRSLARYVLDNFAGLYRVHIRACDSPSEKEFLTYFRELFQSHELFNPLPQNIKGSPNYGIFRLVLENDDVVIQKSRRKKLIVSIYLEKFDYDKAERCAKSLISQTYKPDQVIIWYSNSFEKRDVDKLYEILDKVYEPGQAGQSCQGSYTGQPNHAGHPDQANQAGHEISMSLRPCDDLKQHDVYYHPLQECPDDLLVVMVGQEPFPSNALEKLYKLWMEHPDSAIAVKTVLMNADVTHGMLEGKYWIQDNAGTPGIPSLQLYHLLSFPVLLPTMSFGGKLLSRETILKYCPDDPEIWLKNMELDRDVPVVRTGTDLIPASREMEKVFDNSFDETFQSCLHLLDGKENFKDSPMGAVLGICSPQIGADFLDKEFWSDYYIRTVKNSIKQSEVFRLEMQNIL